MLHIYLSIFSSKILLTNIWTCSVCSNIFIKKSQTCSILFHFFFKQMTLYGLSTDKLKEAQNAYKEEKKKEIEGSNAQKAKYAVTACKEFFAAETDENRKWLTDHGYLSGDSPVLDPDHIEVPQSYLENLLKQLESLQKQVDVIKAAIPEASNQQEEADNNDNDDEEEEVDLTQCFENFKRKKLMEAQLRGDKITDEEILEEWNQLSLKEKKQYAKI